MCTGDENGAHAMKLSAQQMDRILKEHILFRGSIYRAKMGRKQRKKGKKHSSAGLEPATPEYR
jgi:hypothetical protein